MLLVYQGARRTMAANHRQDCGAGPQSHMRSITHLSCSAADSPAMFLAGNWLNSMQGSTRQWGGSQPTNPGPVWSESCPVR